MSLADLIPLAIKASIVLFVFGFGLKASLSDATYLFRHPGQLVRSFLSMNVIMLAFAVAVTQIFSLSTPVTIALIVLALSPVPPFLPGKQLKAGGHTCYTIGLLAAMSAISLVFIPLAVDVVAGWYGAEAHMPFLKVAPVVLVTVILPLLAGIAVHHLAPAFAERASRYVLLFAGAVLVLALIPVLIKMWPSLSAVVGNGTLALLGLFSVVGLIVGHLLGGPDEDDRTVLALATSARHPAVALAIAKLNFPDETEVIAMVFWSLVVATVVAIPYVAWRKRMHAAVLPTASAPPSAVRHAGDKSR